MGFAKRKGQFEIHHEPFASRPICTQRLKPLHPF